MRYNEIPSDEEVVAALQLIGVGATADVLCNELAKAHPVRDCQLAIQRAVERGKIAVSKDWRLTVTGREMAAA